MKRYRTNIVIALKSDLCVSSGQAYAGLIDTDSCMDQNGFPYIPAKRLKGVMREAADLIGIDGTTIDDLFGRGGDGCDADLSIFIEDAVLKAAGSIKDKISEIKKRDKHTCFNQQNIVNLFSSIKTQTKLDDNGVADEQTLRFTRVINHYLPECLDHNQGEMVFLAPIEYAEDTETDLRDIVLAVRHLGMDRNRGLGNVRCSLDTINRQDVMVNRPKQAGESDSMVIIRYTLKNTGPLIMSSSKDDRSEKYISGQAVLGALAGIYLKGNGLSEPDDVFRDIFLSGGSIFSNLYITEGDGTAAYVPAPAFIRKLKKTRKYISMLSDGTELQKSDPNYNPENGNQPKKLNEKYVYYEKDRIRVLEPRTDLVYHHSKKTTYDAGRMGDDPSEGILYAVEALEADQLFSGSIMVKEKYADIILGLIQSPLLRLGKSRTSQYGACKCKVIPCENDNLYEYKRCLKPDYSLKEGDKVIVVLESDAIIPGQYGYTTEFEAVQKYIADYTGLKLVDNPRVFMNSTIVTGYNAKINLKRASLPAVGAGSTFEFIVPEKFDGISDDKYNISKLEYIGAYISEGFGKIRILKKDEIEYKLEGITEEMTGFTSSGSDAGEKPADAENEGTTDTLGDLQIKAMQIEICKKQILEELKEYFIDQIADKNLNISASLIGRVTLMLKDSRADRNPTNPNASVNSVLDDFAGRIASIKRDKERNEIIGKLKSWNVCDIKLQKNRETGRFEVQKVTNLLSHSNMIEQRNHNQFVFDIELLNKIPDDKLQDLWEEYLIFILTHMKYKKSAAKKRKR